MGIWSAPPTPCLPASVPGCFDAQLQQWRRQPHAAPARACTGPLMHSCMRTHRHTHTHECMHKNRHGHVDTHTHACTYIRTRVHAHRHAHECMHTHKYAQTWMHTPHGPTGARAAIQRCHSRHGGGWHQRLPGPSRCRRRHGHWKVWAFAAPAWRAAVPALLGCGAALLVCESGSSSSCLDLCLSRVAAMAIPLRLPCLCCLALGTLACACSVLPCSFTGRAAEAADYVLMQWH